MKRPLAVVALVVGMNAAGTAAGAQERSAEQAVPEIAVSGTGTVVLSPDHAVILVTVVTRDDQAARAGQQNARLMTGVRQALRGVLGVPDDSLPTVSYSVDTDYDRTRPAGYAARSTLEAHVHDLTRVGGVIDAALGAGATNISPVQFGSTRHEAARLEALARAVAAAKRDAEAIARAAGGRLGPLRSVSSGSTPVPYAMPQMRAAAAETPIAAPPLEVSATVSARWGFIPQ